MRVILPAGTSSIGVGGQQFNAGPDGIADVPSSLLTPDIMAAHGLEQAGPASFLSPTTPSATGSDAGGAGGDDSAEQTKTEPSEGAGTENAGKVDDRAAKAAEQAEKHKLANLAQELFGAKFDRRRPLEELKAEFAQLEATKAAEQAETKTEHTEA